MLRADARRNRDALLAAAREAFAEEGLEASLEGIAARAGVSIGTLYNRFGGRVELIDAALCDAAERATALAEAALDEPDPWKALVSHLEALAAMQATDRGFTQVCVRTLPPGSATEEAKQRGQVAFAELVRRAREAGELRADLSVADLGLLVWAVVRATDGIRDTAPDAWRRHLAVLLDGLRADAAHELPGEPLDPEAVAEAMRLA